MQRILVSVFLLALLSTALFVETASAHEQSTASPLCGYTKVATGTTGYANVFLWEETCTQALHVQTVSTDGQSHSLEAVISYLGQSSDIVQYGQSVNSGTLYLSDEPGRVTYCGGDSSRSLNYWVCGTWG